MKTNNRVYFLNHQVIVRCLLPLMAAAWLELGASSLRANAFASNVQLDDVSTNLVTSPGDSVVIRYLLNQDADAGVTISLCYGTNVSWSTNLAGGSLGTGRGTNVFLWEGGDLAGNLVSNGLWSVCITPASAGFTNWTRIPVKNNLGNSSGDGYVWAPSGMAVNNNTNSPYFGRVFVANAESSGFGSLPGDLVGMSKYNADGSDAAEGAFSAGTFVAGGSVPGKIEVGTDDRVYVVDDSSACRVLSFDQLISTNPAPFQVLTSSNLAGGGIIYSGLAVTGSGTNRQIYMTDVGGFAGVGMRRWNMPSGVVDATDLGITVVASDPSFDLNHYPQDVAVDSSNRISVIQNLQIYDTSPRVLGYPAFQATPITNASWMNSTSAVPSAVGLAADLHTNFLAVVCRQDFGNAISIFDRDNGLQLNNTGLNGLNQTQHDYTDAAWDLAGNLYVGDYADGAWRVFDPPGASAFTTTSLQKIKVGPYVHPTLGEPHRAGGQFQLQLNGETGVAYAIEMSTDLIHWTSVVTNRPPAPVSLWTVPAPSAKAFFRARVEP